MRPVLFAAASAALLLSTAALADSDLPRSNPFARPSKLAYGMPPFDRITDADYRPAFEAGMAEQLKEIDAIAKNPDAPTFDNTLLALERSGALLTRVNQVFSNLVGANTDDEMQKIDAEMAPKLAAHRDAIYLNAALFARVQKLYDQRASLDLDPVSAQLLERYHTDFVRAGAQLSDGDKDKLRKLNEEISSLTTKFQQNVLKANNDGAVVVSDVKDLDGLSAEQIGAAAQAAKDRKLDGKWVLTLSNTTGQPLLANLKNRALREKLYRASIARANGGPDDNTAAIARIVRLRAQRAVLLGAPDHATYVLADETAGTPKAVNRMLADLAPGAEANARKDAQDMQKIIDAEAKANHTKSFKFAAWDWDFYAEKLRKQRYDFDESQTRPYFELNRVISDGLFFEAGHLYGLRFKERKDLPVYQKDVRTFEVFDRDGSGLGLLFVDPYARDNKQGGAWMNEYVTQSGLLKQKPVVAIHLNVTKPGEGQPTLLSFDEVTTAFHEFGHALHGLFSDVEYPLLAGTNTPRDFVEYPSQYNEMWAQDPEVFASYAHHWQTGAPMPAELVAKVFAAKNFNEGFATAEYLAASITDQAFHQIRESQAPSADKVMAFETAALKKANVDVPTVPPRYHAPYFLHIFANEYSAGYYAYIWSDVLAEDTADWMRKHGGLKRENGDFLRAKVLSRGRSLDPSEAFKQFYGRDPDVQPLLESRGLAKAKAKAAPAKAAKKKKA